MTQEEKQLLLKDLSARLPYYPYTKIHISTEGKYAPSERDVYLVRIEMWRVRNGECQWLINDYPLEDIRPYLRPMSSMTEEEVIKYVTLTHYNTDDNGKPYRELTIKALDWLNEHHFDYRGLIEKGLALEASEGMYKTE